MGFTIEQEEWVVVMTTLGTSKKESDARTEMKAQFEHLKTKNPKETLKIHKDRVVKVKDKTEEILIIIHPILVR